MSDDVKRNLILRLKERQSVSVNHGELQIIVVEIKGKSAVLRFVANKDILILRDSEKINKENGACNSASTQPKEE